MILSIVIVCFNRWNFTKSTLNDLFKLPQDTHEIIVIDNASTDDTEKELNNIDKNNFIYIRNNTNIFHSEACNQGYKISSGKNVLFLNNDIRIKSNYSDWTNEIIKNCDDAIVGPTMGQLDSKLNFVKESNEHLSGNSYLSGWCIGSSKENWSKVDIDGAGQIWNNKYPFYFNDGDLSFRCRNAALPLKIVPIPVVHFGKISAAQINIPKLYNDGRKIFINEWKKLIS